jgi:RNA polymerase sigma-70 factor (ECF subfamily)
MDQQQPHQDARTRDFATATSLSLIARLQSREPDAWEQLLALYGPLIYSWCRQSELSPEDASDVVQEVLLKVFNALPNYRRDRPGDTFRGWLLIVTKNAIRDHYRRQQGKARGRGGTTAMVQLQDYVAVIDSVTGSGYGDLVQRAAARIRREFSDRDWRVFELTVLDRRSSQETAAQLNMRPAAVRKAKSRLLRRLREELGDEPNAT